MPSDPRLAALPALRKLAEEEARDIWTRHVRLFALHLPDMRTVADPNDASDGFFVTVEAQVERLADLSRPASRDAVARLVAERLGLEWGATAPGLHRSPAGGRSHWQIGYFPWSTNVWVVDAAADWNRGQRVIVPGISAVTDPAGALTLIALQVLA